MDWPCIPNDEGPFRDKVFSIRVVPRNGMCNTQRDNWLPTMKLLAHQSNVWKTFAVSKFGEPMCSNDSIQLFLCLPLDLWIADHCKNKRMQGRDCLRRGECLHQFNDTLTWEKTQGTSPCLNQLHMRMNQYHESHLLRQPERCPCKLILRGMKM